MTHCEHGYHVDHACVDCKRQRAEVVDPMLGVEAEADRLCHAANAQWRRIVELERRVERMKAERKAASLKYRDQMLAMRQRAQKAEAALEAEKAAGPGALNACQELDVAISLAQTSVVLKAAESAIASAGFRVAPDYHGAPTLWCIECSRDSGMHWETCSKVKRELERGGDSMLRDIAAWLRVRRAKTVTLPLLAIAQMLESRAWEKESRVIAEKP